MPIYRLKPLREKYSDLEGEIVRLVNQHGQHRTAARLGVSVTTINRWLKDNGYHKKIIYVRNEQPQGMAE